MKLKIATLDETLRYGSKTRRYGKLPRIAGAAGALVLHAAASSTSSVATFGAVDTTGANLLVINAIYASAPAVADNKGNTWNALTAQTSGGVSSQLFYAQNPTVGAGHTFTVTANFPSAELLAFSGMQSAPFDQQNGATGGPNVTTGSITPTADNAVVVTGAMGINNSTPTVDSSLTVTDGVAYVSGTNYGSAMAYGIEGVAQAINPTWTAAGGDNIYAAVIASFLTAIAQAPVAKTPKRMPLGV